LKPKNFISLLQYNQLAGYLGENVKFPYCKPEILKMDFRQKIIFDQLMIKDGEDNDMDIIQIQEVDNFHKFLKPKLSEVGYDSVK
jgi:mRNA deadenylase 3'-5' endonuclease subunit Ccr4